ncbi:hypothetical protein HGM15179_013443 [Zosterops borbonicus]|uniref:ATP synthase F(0) complex subunit e, mitochondrial n=2 Tax=Passeriformes TaxID=9126 RepID=A0A8K1G813_9PASS|nr:hypothetical protein HGM15179_013443 [Zosterops borbonicus]
MIPPVQVSPLIKFTRYSALLVGMIYGKKRYDYLKPIAEEERRIEAEEKKKREELERIAKEIAEASCLLHKLDGGKFADSALDPTVHVTDKTVEQCQLQY